MYKYCTKTRCTSFAQVYYTSSKVFLIHKSFDVPKDKRYKFYFTIFYVPIVILYPSLRGELLMFNNPN